MLVYHTGGSQELEILSSKRSWKEEALAHAQAEMPRESCGLLVVIKGRKRYWPCKNLTADTENFILDPDDYCKAEDAGTIVGVVHSHPKTPPYPSVADRLACKRSELPWEIVNPILETWGSCKPENFEPDLVGREWVWNVMDCWSCVHTWYKQQGLDLPDYTRPTTPEEFDADPLFERYWADAGFYEIPEGEPLQIGDALLMSIGSDSLNHVGVLVENTCVQHHLRGRLSSVDMYGGWLERCTGRRLRHYDWKTLAVHAE